eukprot:TRINITY_DN21718_c0_g2_i2.p1 TRINITY_DN21718_c0_g2~~TRINITY_DN21718_c0_g2_i2.p1  ORF type:complete len:751 (+),score=177.28 TRINITY_DN21718_c0_g2_i2:153-2405(+)
MKRPASALSASSAAKRHQSGVARRPAAAQAARRKPAAARKNPRQGYVAASAPAEPGDILFKEPPALAAQTTRAEGEHLAEQPLFCAQCCAPAGPLEAALALATGRICRAELLEFVRSNDGDGPSLLRWLDFASKTPALPWHVAPARHTANECSLFVPRSEAAVEGDVTHTPCFCSARCRASWEQSGHPAAASRARGIAWKKFAQCVAAAGDHEGLLIMAASALGGAAASSSSPRRLVTRQALTRALRPLLAAAPRAGASSKEGPPRRALLRAHRLLIETRVEASLEEQRLQGGPRVSAAELRRRAAAEVPLELYERLVIALDARAWALNGGVLPSPLGQYCETVCSPDVPPELQTALVAAIGPAVRSLREQQDALDLEKEDIDDDEGEAEQTVDAAGAAADALVLPTPEHAQTLCPSVVPGLFSEADVAAVRELSESLAAREHRKHASESQWRTRYLHAAGVFRDRLPALLERLESAAVGVDERCGWGLLRGFDVSKLRPRVIEHHIVGPGGALPDPTHFDGGSVLTIDVMLSRPGEDFEGGTFCTAEAPDGRLQSHAFGLGDALVFASHKPHCVQPVRSGRRETLILELWDGEERRCDHRCPQHRGACALESVAASICEQQDKGEPTFDLETVRSESAGAFVSTAFEGLVFYEKIAQIAAQSDRLRAQRRRGGAGATKACFEPNVEVVFEDAGAVATVRALRRMRRGEPLVLAPSGEIDDSTDEAADCEEESESEEDGGQGSGGDDHCV